MSSNSKIDFKLLFFLLIGIIVIWLILWLLLAKSFTSWAERGQFGDMFGVFNSLFSGLAFAGIIFTIYLQREELGLQREELKLTREELSRTANAQEQAQKALAEQVEALHRSAHLTALSALIENYKIKIDRTPSASAKLAAENKHLAYIAEMESLLDAIKKFQKP